MVPRGSRARVGCDEGEANMVAHIWIFVAVLGVLSLPLRSDGRFVTTMDVTGFSEVGP